MSPPGDDPKTVIGNRSHEVRRCDRQGTTTGVASKDTYNWSSIQVWTVPSIRPDALPEIQYHGSQMMYAVTPTLRYLHMKAIIYHKRWTPK